MQRDNAAFRPGKLRAMVGKGRLDKYSNEVRRAPSHSSASATRTRRATYKGWQLPPGMPSEPGLEWVRGSQCVSLQMHHSGASPR